MFAGQRKLCRGVIEPRGERVLRDLPTRGRMTSRTVAGEPALMRISMTARAFGEVQSRIPSRCGHLICGVALLARQNLVRSGQRKAGELVIESNDRLPAIGCMARCAVHTELSAMRIDVAGPALRPQSEKRFIEVLCKDSFLFIRCDGFLVVALTTFQYPMLPL